MSTLETRPLKAHVWAREKDDCAPIIRSKRETEIGAAGEHLVCADLILQGHRAFLAAQGLPYDVVADYDNRLIRIAVKSTSLAKARPAREGSRVCYQFNVTRPRRLCSGKTDARAYSIDDVDIVALVALDIKTIAYVAMAACKTSMHIDAEGHIRGTNKFGPKNIMRRKCFADFSLLAAVEIC
jgi:hypothetical protein